MAAQQVISSTAQQFLDIFDITNDILILKDGSTALIITVNAMNFGLLAEPEQDAIMYAYAGLLNSLNYSIQIVIRSQTKDVTGYLGLLKDEEEKTVSDTKKRWIRKYREFVADLITERNVLDKKFYVVIPASALEMGLLPPSTVIPGIKQPDLTTVERSVILEKAQEILEPKRDHLMAQFGRIGLVSRQLQTQEIIQLFYLSYNPEAADGQLITDTSSYTAPLVQADIQGGFMDTPTTQPLATPTPTVDPAVVLGGTPTPPPAQQPAQQPAQPAMPMQPQPAAPEMSVQPAEQPVMPSPVVPESPAMAAPTMGLTPETPAISVPGTVQPAMPIQPQPVMATPELDIQNEINSSLQQLSGAAAAPSQPAATAVPASPVPAVENTTTITTPPNTPTPVSPQPTMGVSTPAAPDATPPQSGTDTLPPLPEI